MGATFFSCDPSGWPNFATIVTTDEHDMGEPSRLSREGVFRLNIGVSRSTFKRLVGAAADDPSTDYAALDRFVPHPVYAKQLWISILNPSRRTYDDEVRPLLAEAYERVARSARRKAAGATSAAEAARG
ncbi:MAG TPA: DUF6194 family protein, partial [Candidatus Limnocylindrales bacterium]